MCAAEWRNYSNIKDNLPIEKVFYQRILKGVKWKN